MQICRLDPACLGEIQPIFRQVFGHEISLGFLQWKYGKGLGESWIYRDDHHNPVLHCGIFYRDVILDSRAVRVSQLTDLMALPKRSGLSRQDAPFTSLMRKVLAELQGPENPEALAFGVPSQRAMRLGERMGVYRSVDEWHELSFPSRPRSTFYRKPQEIQAIDSGTATAINQLWLAMARDLADFPVGRRDAPYIARRYLQHPEHKYCCLLIRSHWLQKPIGLAVLRKNETDFELLDIIGPLSAIPDVLRQLQSWTQGTDRHLFKWNLTSSFAARFATFAERSEPTQFRIMANPFTPSTTLEKFDHKWWLTGGDTDYR